jgi:glycosyltransferase involved in cell wall biosynthesis
MPPILKPKVSFIVPSYNSSKTVSLTLESIFEQTDFDCILDVIIVDSSDKDQGRISLKKYQQEKVKLIELPQKTWPAIARNLGAKEAKAEILIFIDSDVYLERTWLSAIITAHKEGCLFGSGGVLVSESQKHNSLPVAQLYLQFNEYLAVGKRHKIGMVPSCNMFCDRSVFNKAGGFPEIRASEDVSLSLIIGKSTDVWFIPEAVAYHIFRENWDSFRQNQILLGKYVIIYRKIFSSSMIYRWVFPIFLFPLFLFVKLARIIWRIIKAGPAHYLKFIKVFHFFIIGFIFWSFGFLKGCVTRTNGNLS